MGMAYGYGIDLEPYKDGDKILVKDKKGFKQAFFCKYINKDSAIIEVWFMNIIPFHFKIKTKNIIGKIKDVKENRGKNGN